MSRIDQNVVGQLHQLAMETVVKHGSELLWREGRREIGTADIADEERVSGQNSPWARPLLRVGDHQADTLGCVPRRFQYRDLAASKSHLGTVVDTGVRKSRAGFLPYINASTGASG